MQILLLTTLAVAAVLDVRTRRIPNLLTIPVTLAFMILYTASNGADGLVSSLTGALLGIIIGLACCILGVCGGGDMKLLMCTGAILGRGNLLVFLPYSLVSLGFVSALYLMRDGLLRIVLTKMSLAPIVGLRKAFHKGYVIKTTLPVALPMFLGGVLYVCLGKTGLTMMKELF